MDVQNRVLVNFPQFQNKVTFFLEKCQAQECGFHEKDVNFVFSVLFSVQFFSTSLPPPLFLEGVINKHPLRAARSIPTGQLSCSHSKMLWDKYLYR